MLVPITAVLIIASAALLLHNTATQPIVRRVVEIFVGVGALVRIARIVVGGRQSGQQANAAQTADGLFRLRCGTRVGCRLLWHFIWWFGLWCFVRFGWFGCCGRWCRWRDGSRRWWRWGGCWRWRRCAGHDGAPFANDTGQNAFLRWPFVGRDDFRFGRFGLDFLQCEWKAFCWLCYASTSS